MNHNEPESNQPEGALPEGSPHDGRTSEFTDVEMDIPREGNGSIEAEKGLGKETEKAELQDGDHANKAPAGDEASPEPVSRKDLLDIVRKHSDALPRQGVAPNVIQGADSNLMDARYWQTMLDLFFVKGWGGRGENGGRMNPEALFDDMLFFVRTREAVESAQKADAKKEKAKPYFVRRWGTDLDKLVGDCAAEVDWRLSFYLNLICHSAYTLTVAVCSRQALDAYKKTKSSVTPICKVTKRVYASPSRARIDMDVSKARETVPAYPDICFAIDDYDDSFDAVVLSDPDHCFCVLLNAHGGAAFPPDGLKPTAPGVPGSLGRRTSSEARALGEASDGPYKVTLFSGFVSYKMVQSAFQGGKPRFALWGQSSNRPERLVMHGPGGRGEADVAVSTVPVEAATTPGPAEPASPQRTTSTPVRASKPPLSPSPSSAALSGSGGSGSGSGSGSGDSKLQEHQAELWSVQEELMKLVQVHQLAISQHEGDEESRARKEEVYLQQLHQLQEELKRVQAKLQGLQDDGKGSLGGPPAPSGAPPAAGADGSGDVAAPAGGAAAGGGGGGGGGDGSGEEGSDRWDAHAGGGGGSKSSEEGGGATRVAVQALERGLSGVLRKAAAVVASSVTGGGAGSATAGASRAAQMRCCLMSLSLPWDSLAYDLLFKDMPVKVDITGHILPRLPSREI